jgi:hypothetical protein
MMRMFRSTHCLIRSSVARRLSCLAVISKSSLLCWVESRHSRSDQCAVMLILSTCRNADLDIKSVWLR